MSESTKFQLSGLLLAGGQGSRLGGRDKGLMPWAGRPVAEHLVELLRTQVGEVLISCNRNQQRYQLWADIVVGDAQADYPGPLAGILAGLKACSGSHLLIVPCDLPRLEQALLVQLCELAREQPERPVLARSAEAWQPLLAVIPKACLPALEQAWQAGQRSPLRWLLGENASVLELPADDPQLLNANRLEDWQ
ncbi:molybdenum cofactor guanylyltransferase MobA [Pseudomonas jilinensis]|uniref:Molybdenum cofactor guanylyltransferase n=1 Tax=Pseudomonas jilinensis TaxID=2078689 RepID=A0A396SEU1_9PSED|nr:molybdenum cofactor guanylyltransferase MobA [Pseudomonas jilinensis]RHW22075.1 molybdenum cofactor guanylyltransferase MobA [Pseudomonas jilinensis]